MGSSLFAQQISQLWHKQISTAAHCCIVCMCAASVARVGGPCGGSRTCSIGVYINQSSSQRMRMLLISILLAFLQHSSVDGFVEPPVPPTKSASRHSLPRCRNSFTSTEEHPHIGNYRLLKTIGKGNFAKVKLARHVLTGREVRRVFIDILYSKSSGYFCFILIYDFISKTTSALLFHCYMLTVRAAA